MKIIVSLFFVLFASQAMALPVFKNKRMTVTEFQQFVKSLPSTKSDAVSVPRAKSSSTSTEVPVRQGELKVEIYRMEVVVQSDGSISVTYGSHCLGKVPANVYDLRGLPVAVWPVGPVFSCPADFDGKPATVSVTGDILLTEGSLFSGEPVSEIKTGYGNLEVRDGTSSVLQGGAGLVSARGHTAPSLLDWIDNGNSFSTCVPSQNGSGDMICSPTSGVYYSAMVEYLD